MVTRKFVPGTEWLYLKIYTGAKTADIILEDVIKPLVEYFHTNIDIKEWFFVRYCDPKPHLRLRFRLTNLDKNDEVLKNIIEALKNFIDAWEIANIVIDTYNREIERYGENTIGNAEELFFKSSELVLNFLGYDDEEKLMVSMFYIDHLLSEIKLPDQEKFEWITDFNQAFKKEFNADKNLNSQLDKKFRLFKPKYLDFANSDDFIEIKEIIISNINKTNDSLENVIQNNQSWLSEFFQSIFHMHINRTFNSNQRLFEMIVYDYLFRYYKTKFRAKLEKIQVFK